MFTIIFVYIYTQQATSDETKMYNIYYMNSLVVVRH